VQFRCSVEVDEILTSSDLSKATGVKTVDGQVIKANRVISNTSIHSTVLGLLKNNSSIPKDYVNHVKHLEYASPVFKINVALDQLPNFKCLPNESPNQPGPQHRGTIHMNSETLEEINQSYVDAKVFNRASQSPMIEMTVPSVLDPTLAPPGKHVASLFCQYVPYAPGGSPWTEQSRKEFVDQVFAIIDESAPGFSSSVLHADILAPPDLERIFGLPGGNISHHSMSLDQVSETLPFLFTRYVTRLSFFVFCFSSFGLVRFQGGQIIERQ
jgi:phytoene dehydrogenase-like protein